MDWDNGRVDRVLIEVKLERLRQYSLYGSNPLNSRVDKMLFVLGEEVGEVNAAMVEYISAEIAVDMMSGKMSTKEEDHAMTVCKEKMAHVRKELVQGSAVAVAMVELIDSLEEETT